MGCYHPVEVSIVRKSFYPGPRINDLQEVPCGNCLGCRARQAAEWTMRIMHESRMHDDAWFLTLTYDQERLPENGSLSSRDFQGFFKALRKGQPAKSIRYFGCGEYGDTSKRPHYHAVVFGCPFIDRRLKRTGVWNSESLDRYWPRGISEFGRVTNASAAYVAGYVRKKISKKVYPEAYERVVPETGEVVCIEQEFSRMSLKPAIGRDWITQYWADVYPRDFVVIAGREFKPPRYYDKFMDLEDEKGGDARRREVMMHVREKRISELREVTDYELNAREVDHEARVDLFMNRSKI